MRRSALAGEWARSRFVQGFLFKLDAGDPVVYALAAVVLCCEGLAAAVPARRASRVDPLVALRDRRRLDGDAEGIVIGDASERSVEESPRGEPLG